MKKNERNGMGQKLSPLKHLNLRYGRKLYSTSKSGLQNEIHLLFVRLETS